MPAIPALNVAALRHHPAAVEMADDGRNVATARSGEGGLQFDVRVDARMQAPEHLADRRAA
jgi:hypothetical protein